MTAYVASALENWERVKTIQDWLRLEGVSFPHDWASIYEGQLAGMPEPDGLPGEQVRAASSVDCLLLLTPGGRGAHIEFGAALGAGVPTVVLLDGAVRPIGFYGCATRVVDSPGDAIAAVLDIVRGAR